ncbi:MAG: calcium-binding protein [Pyrinomonadaceae bacterium]
MQELFGTSDPFKISWSFRATNLSTNSRVPVFVNALPEVMAVQVQLLDNKRGIEVTFPAKPANNIYELEATAQITDTYGITNIVRHRFWSHALTGDAEQLEENVLPTVAELASESPDEIMSASTSDVSGSPLDEVDVPDDMIAKFMDARMVRFGIMDGAEDEQITIDELRHYIRGARMFEPNDVTCLGVPATIVGTDEPDRLVGTATDDVIVGLGGQDVIFGGGGDDIICGGEGSDVVVSGAGEDIVDGGPGSDELFGGPDSDQLGGSMGDDMINGGVGFDVLKGGFGPDTIQGGGNDDMIDGGSGSDEINGGPGSDTIQGGEGNDMIDGAGGGDLINSGPGNDTCINDVTIFCE